MQFSCDAEILHRGISVVQNVAQSKIANPVIENVLIIAEENRVLFIGTNLAQTIRCTANEVDVKKEGEIAVPARYMGNLVRELGEGPVNVALKRNRLQVNSGKSEYHIGGIPADEFPRFLPLAEGQSLSLTTMELKQIIRKTVFATSSEKARFELDGVKVESEKGKVVFVATDGRRLSYLQLAREDESGGTISALVPTRTWQELARVVEENEPVEVKFGEGKVMFEAGDITLISSLLGDNFPPYDQIVPKGFAKKVVVSRQGLDRAVRRACVLASESTNQITMRISEGELLVRGESQTLGDAKDVVEADYKGETITVSYKGDYVIDFLKAATTENVVIEINDPVSPAGCREMDNQDYLHIIMPMKVQEEEVSGEEE